MLAGAIWALVGERAPLVLFIPFASSEVALGNIHLLLALAIAIGYRWPATWAFVLLTKPTLAVCLIWFLLRGEWRRLAIALGATACVAAVSFVLAPSLWSEYLSFLKSNAGTIPPEAALAIPALPRVLVAAIVVAVAARLSWPWSCLSRRLWPTLCYGPLRYVCCWLSPWRQIWAGREAASRKGRWA